MYLAKFFDKASKKTNEDEEISLGQVYVVPESEKKISVSKTKTTDLLAAISQASDKYDAIDKILSQTPDGKMALNTYLRIANQGVTIKMHNANNGKVVKKHDAEVRAFCSHMGGNTAEGLDGIIDQLHTSSIAHGGMACEVVVGSKASGIEGVIIIDPKTITEFEWLEDKHRYAAYQQGQGNKKVDLYDGNFFWIPHQPMPGRPDGTLQFEPAILTMTQYYQLLKDSEAVLHRIGFPRYDVSIDTEKLMAAATPEQKSDAEKRKKLVEKTFADVSNGVRRADSERDFVHFDSFTVETIGGGVNGSGIDVRAWFEMLEPLVVNSFQLTPVLMGRLKSGSYALGTAQYKVIKDNIEVLRRGSKRMLENVLNIFARVNGWNEYAVVEHNPIEWEIVKEKLEAQLKQMELARRAEEYNWVDHETAAILGLGTDADPQPENKEIVAYVKNLTQKKADGNEDDKQEDEKEKEGDKKE